MNAIGRKVWAIPGGRIPLRSTGREPEFTSHDKIGLLNASDREAHVEMTIYYADRDPVGPYRVTVPARRMRPVRFNDLIDPQPIPLETDYACIIESDLPIVVQFSRLDTGREGNALLGMIAFPGDGSGAAEPALQ